ncbi:LysR family transcriptional regulator [Comamonas flocculans]|uniref:LysR family transcriptional regulator n=1 Tax=Comamonas flocculans TaxID=2597701 RepID=A0A5B8RUD8_9BURK|nr:LysR family transcriptional regulator [Comamonas flocculans]QEA12352.1 LysR family transcriptional regulator [Comamonas flocculans]
MRLRHIEVFHAIMLSGSVSGAARMLNVTQPAVSRTLQHAELQLGFALFQRAGGRLQPTPEAQALFPQVERLFAQLGDVQRLSANLKAGREQGVLRILTVPGLGLEAFPRAVQRFRVRHPRVLLHHQTLHTAQILAALVLQEADLGYVFNVGAHPALVSEAMVQQDVVCVAPKAMLPDEVVRSGKVALAQLAGLPVIGIDHGDPLGRVLGRALDEAQLRLDVVVSVQTYHVALALAHHGVGVALVEACTAVSADRGRVDVLPLLPDLHTAVHALRMKVQAPSQAMRTFTRCMQQTLRQMLDERV